MSLHTAPLIVPADHPLIRTLVTAYEKAMGETAELLVINGRTYARCMQNNGVAFGAS